MATTIKSKTGLKKLHKDATNEVKSFFEHVPGLIDQFPMHVCLAYAFSRLELGQNNALYCGAVKIYRVNTATARSIIGSQHITRKSFPKLYKTILGRDLPKTAHDDIKSAESTRDKVIHGKAVTDDAIRNAIARALEFAEEVNKDLHAAHSLKPFGSLQGFAGASKKLDAATSAFILRGMGFGKQAEDN